MKKSHRVLALALAALGVLFRPTSAVIWLYPGVLHLLQTPDRGTLLALQVLPIAGLTLAAMLLIDRWGYGEWTFVPFNFFKFNVLEVRARWWLGRPGGGLANSGRAGPVVCVCRAKTDCTGCSRGGGTSRRASPPLSAPRSRSLSLGSSLSQYGRLSSRTAWMYRVFKLVLTE